MNKPKKYILYYDMLNIGACFCVILMHCNGVVHQFSNTRVWKEALGVDVLAYWAVPIFFMLSGATLIGYKEKYDTKTYFRKRFSKTLIPFFAWNIINLFLKVYKGEIDLKMLNPMDILGMIVNNQIEFVYWFFIPLFLAYLSIPVLSALRENIKILKYMAMLGIITYSVLPFIFNVFHLTYNGNLYFPLAGGYILYVIIGYLLSVCPITKKQRYIIYLGGILGIVIRYGATYVLSIRENALNKVTWDYKNFPALLLSIAVFVFFKYIEWDKIFKTEKIKEIIRKISGASFGVYLIHMLVIRGLLHYFGWDMLGWKWRYGGAVIVYVCALTIVLLMKKIPLIKRIVP